MVTFIDKVSNVEKNVYKAINELTDVNAEIFLFKVGEALTPDYAATDEGIQKACALLNKCLLAMKVQAAVRDSDLTNVSLNEAKTAMITAAME